MRAYTNVHQQRMEKVPDSQLCLQAAPPIQFYDYSEEETQCNQPDDTINVYTEEQAQYFFPASFPHTADENADQQHSNDKHEPQPCPKKRKQSCNPWAVDSMRWTPAADVALLLEVENLQVQTLNNHEQKLAWNQIVIALHEGDKEVFGNLKSGEACKKRFEKLRGWHRSNNKNLRKAVIHPSMMRKCSYWIASKKWTKNIPKPQQQTFKNICWKKDEPLGCSHG
jgi:hypothetical protein